MPDVEHANLTDPELHELKGAAVATAGQVPVADGLGSTVFTNGAGNIFNKAGYGNMYMASNASLTSIPTQNTFVELSGTMSGGSLLGTTFGANRLTISSGYAGYYFVIWSFSVSQSGGAGYDYQHAIAKNGTPLDPKMTRFLNNSGDIGIGTIQQIVQLASGDFLSPMVTNIDSSGKNILVGDMSFTAFLLREV